MCRIVLLFGAALAFGAGALQAETAGGVLWQTRIGTISEGPTIGSDGTIYIPVGDNFGSPHQVVAVGPDGTQKWAVPGRFSSPSLADDGTIYVAGGGLRALNADGLEKWRYELLGDKTGAAIAEDGTIYFCAIPVSGSLLIALNPDGTKKWEVPIGLRLHNAPAIGQDGVVYVVTSHAFRTDNRFMAVNPDGTIQWTMDLQGEYGSAPAIDSEGNLYFSYGKHLHVLRPDGSKLWEFASGGGPSPAIGADGTIYFGSLNHQFYAMNPDGTLKWQYDAGEPIRSSAALGADGGVYFASQNHFHALNADGTLRWRFDETGGYASPIIHPDGIAVFGSYNGNLYAFSGAGDAMKAPWPMAGHDLRRTGRAEGSTALRILSHPRSQTVSEGNSATFSIEAISGESLEYQWRFNGAPLDGATSSTYTIPFVRSVHAGRYDVVVRAASGSGVSAAAILEVMESQAFVERQLPDGYHLGSSFEVTLSARPLPNVVVYAVEDQPPAGWAVHSISHDGAYDLETGRVKFGPFHDAHARDLTYQVTPPKQGEANVNRFSGAASIQGVPTPIIGDQSLDLQAVFYPADILPADNTLSMDEVTSYGFAWILGDAWQIAPNPIPESYVERATALWKGGERYVYDIAEPEELLRWLNPAGAWSGESIAVEPSIASDSVASIASTVSSSSGELIWEKQLAGTLSSPVLGLDGTVYVGVADPMAGINRLYAFQPDGTVKWEVADGFASFLSAAVSDDGTLYVGRGSPAHTLEAYTPEGSKLWEYKTDHFVVTLPAIGRDGAIHFGSADGNVYALHADGTKRWQMSVGRSTSAAISSDGTIYFVGDENPNPPAGDVLPVKLYAVNPDGTIVWTRSFPASFPQSPIIGEHGIYVLAAGALRAFSPEGEEIGNFSFDAQMQPVTGAVIGIDGTIYFGTGSKLLALNPDGTEKWHLVTDSLVSSTPTLGDDGMIYIQTANRFVALNEDGSPAWFLGFSTFYNVSPVAGDGVVYFISRNKLCSVRTSSRLANSPWPMLGHDSQRSGRSGGATVFRFLSHPKSLNVEAGAEATFSVDASGEGPFRYRWRHNGVEIAGATNSTLRIRAVREADAGIYHALVSNNKGSALSGGGTLTVSPGAWFVERTFPSAFYSDTPFEVTLSAIPTAHAKVYAIEEKPPAGWTVESMSLGGVYDARQKKIKFGPFFDGNPREFTYKVLPPSGGAAAQNQFIGVASANGVSTRIHGVDSVTIETLMHPADVSPADNAIKIDEAAAYAAAWQTGELWPVAPNPISVNYVTRAGALWKRGENYIYDGTREDALRWLSPSELSTAGGDESTASVLQVRSRLATPAPADSIGSATRSFGDGSKPGKGIVVRIEVAPPAGGVVYALEDNVPENWVMSEISHEGRFDAANRAVKWGPFYDTTARVLSYEISSDSEGANPSLSGTASFDGYGIGIIHARDPRVPQWGPIHLDSSGTLQIEFSATLGERYRIEASEDLRAWIELSTVVAEGDSVIVKDTTDGQLTHRFYRVLQE